jgi:hypothetical protein
MKHGRLDTEVNCIAKEFGAWLATGGEYHLEVEVWNSRQRYTMGLILASYANCTIMTIFN